MSFLHTWSKKNFIIVRRKQASFNNLYAHVHQHSTYRLRHPDSVKLLLYSSMGLLLQRCADLFINLVRILVPLVEHRDCIDGAQWVSEVAQLCLTLCDPMDCSPPGSSVHRIFQARTLEWVAISFSRRSSQPRDWTRVSGIVGRRFIAWATREVQMGLHGTNFSTLKCL